MRPALLVRADMTLSHEPAAPARPTISLVDQLAARASAEQSLVRHAVGGRHESVLGVLPGICASSRTTVVLSKSLCGHTSLRLQTESHSDDMGWFPQGSVELSAEQLDAMRPLLAIATTKLSTAPTPTSVQRQAWDETQPIAIPMRARA